MGTNPSQATEPSVPPPGLITTAPTISPPPGTVGPGDVGNPANTPSLMAIPVQPPNTSGITGGSGPGIDASNLHKFYTFSVALRETYDDNVNTSSSNKVTALETSLSPSVLVSFPMENTQFSAGYTFDATYYSETGNTGNNLQYSHQFVANYAHQFSERFTVTAADNFIDSPEPNIYGTTGTPYRAGQNISNAFNGGFSAQWTPLFGTQTTYGNTIVRYLDNSSAAINEDSDENTASQTLSFTIVPNVDATCGGIFDTIDYDQNPRGYTSYTGFVGTTWEALPNLTFSGRVGGSYTETEQQLANGQTGQAGSASPYADLSLSWQLGARSSLSADYSYENTPSDYFGSSAQQSNRFSGNFNYQVTPQISTHLQVGYTYSDISGNDIYLTSSTPSYTETVYQADAGASYNFIKYFSLTLDITESGVSSQLAGQNYNREEVSVGVRGTY